MLQGSLDDFALDEVLSLLSSTSKTGRLHLDGDRGAGSLTLRDGELVDAEATGTGSVEPPEDVLFELLRYGSGTFTFTVIDVPGDSPARKVPEVLDAAEARLADFRTIEAVVPSLGHHLKPVATLPADEVTIGRREWAALLAIGGGGPVSAVCEALGLNEIEGSRQVKGLVDRGLIELTEPRAEGAAPGGPVESGSAGGRDVQALVDDPAGPGPEPGGAAGAKGGAIAWPEPTSADRPPDPPDPFRPNVFAEPRPLPGGHGAVPVGAGDDDREHDRMGPPTGPAPMGLLPPVERPERPQVPAAPPIGDGGEWPAEGPEDRRILGDDRPPFDTNPGGPVDPAPPAGPDRDTAEGQGDVEDDGRPGGLLMRYLKSDG